MEKKEGKRVMGRGFNGAHFSFFFFFHFCAFGRIWVAERKARAIFFICEMTFMAL